MKKTLSLILMMLLVLIPTFSYAELYYDSGYTYDNYYYDDYNDNDYDDDDYYYDEYDDYYYDDEYYGDEEIPLGVVIFVEAFVTIHMSVFVLLPMANLLDKENPKKLFWFFFCARIVMLLYCDFFVTPMVFMVDFIAVFVGAFIIVPITAGIQATRESRELKKLKKDLSPDCFTRTKGFESDNTNDDPIQRY